MPRPFMFAYQPALLAGIFLFLALLTVPAGTLWGEESPGPAANVGSGSQGVAGVGLAVTGSGKPTERLREGTRLMDVRGTFVAIGADSVTFSRAGSKDAVRVLENLALQRISQQLDENRGQRQWIVSGTITEFRGANFLLVTKAVQTQEADDMGSR